MTLTWKKNAGNIWCRGDSITRGLNDDTGGWRILLNSRLATAGISVNFVGPLTDSNSLKHHGNIGDTIANASVNSDFYADQLRPAISILWLGVNDVLGGDSLSTIKTNYDTTVTEIFTGCPWTRLLMIDCMDVGGAYSAYSADTAALAAAQPSWAAAYVGLGYDVTLISVRSVIVPDNDTDDGVHPTASGYTKIEAIIGPAVIAALRT